jgi:hypothetical protein
MATSSSVDDLRQRADRGDQVAVEQMVWGFAERLDYNQAGVWALRLGDDNARRTYLKSWVLARSGDMLQAKRFLLNCGSEPCKVLYSSILLEGGQLKELSSYTRDWWLSSVSPEAFVWHAYCLLVNSELSLFDSFILEADGVAKSKPDLLGYLAGVRNLRPKK